MRTMTAQATGAGWLINGQKMIGGDTFGNFLAAARRYNMDVVIHRFDTSCDECGAAPNENHVFGCQYLLD